MKAVCQANGYLSFLEPVNMLIQRGTTVELRFKLQLPCKKKLERPSSMTSAVVTQRCRSTCAIVLRRWLARSLDQIWLCINLERVGIWPEEV